MNNFYIKHAQKIRFLLVGCGNTIVGILLFPALYFLLPTMRNHYLFLMIISQIFCITFSYFTNKYWVFKTKKNSFLEYVRFTLFYNIVFLINLIFLPWAVSRWHVNPGKIQLMINVFIAMSSYFWHQYITFKPGTK